MDGTIITNFPKYWYAFFLLQKKALQLLNILDISKCTIKIRLKQDFFVYFFYTIILINTFFLKMAFKLLVNRTCKKTCVVEFINYCVSHNIYGRILSIILHKPHAPIRHFLVMNSLRLDRTECVIKDMHIICC